MTGETLAIGLEWSSTSWIAVAANRLHAYPMHELDDCFREDGIGNSNQILPFDYFLLTICMLKRLPTSLGVCDEMTASSFHLPSSKTSVPATDHFNWSYRTLRKLDISCTFLTPSRPEFL